MQGANFLPTTRTALARSERPNHWRTRQSTADRPASESEFEASGAWGIATAIDMYDCNPEILRSAEAIDRFTREVCDRLGVKRFGDPQIVRFGSDPKVYGYSMVQLIETSLVSAHFAEDSNAVYLDIFSCKWYDAGAATVYARQFFGARRVRVRSGLRL
jgi:S-adenosylmethionine/arginine decarboxylase-like enzyme